MTLWYREHNDSGIKPIAPWKSLTNISGTGNTWEFEIPNYNVTLDGLDYYLVASDPTGNLANEGWPSTPYKINVPDEVDPVISQIFDPGIPSTTTEGNPLTVTIEISDNDRTYSWAGSETGTTTISYKRSGDSVFTSVPMIRISGDSSTGAPKGTWEGTIGGNNFTVAFSPVQVRLVGLDKSGNEITQLYSINVVQSGVPILTYVDQSVSVTGTYNHTLSFDVENEAPSGTPATATVNAIQVMLINSTKTNYITGDPYLTQINVTTTEVWDNDSTAEGANDTKITLDTTFPIVEDGTVTLKMVFANSTGGYYDVNDFIANVTVFYTYGAAIADQAELLFETPVTTYLFHDDWDDGDDNGWQVIYDPSPQTYFDAKPVTYPAPYSFTEDVYQGYSRASSGHNVWSWITPQTFDPPFEVVVQFYSYSGSGNRMAFVIFDHVSDANTIYAAGARVGATDGRISQYTVTSDSWSTLDTNDYNWGEDTWVWMKVSVTTGKTITVYYDNIGTWTSIATYTQPNLPDSIHVGLFVDYAQTDFDNMTIYHYGDAPDPHELPAPMFSGFANPMFSVLENTNLQTSLSVSNTAPTLKVTVETNVVLYRRE